MFISIGFSKLIESKYIFLDLKDFDMDIIPQKLEIKT